MSAVPACIPMTRLPPTRVRIAVAGLDLLSSTRVKVACSLLMAERLEIELAEWDNTPVAALVAHDAQLAGRSAIAAAERQGLPLLVISRQRGIGAAPWLSHGATVREIADALRQTLQQSAASPARTANDGGVRLPPLLERLRLDRPHPAPVLMENGLLRVVVDTRSGMLHMLRRMPLEQLLDSAAESSWYATELVLAEWETRYRPDVTVSHVIESLWWQLAARGQCALPGHAEGAIGLSAWPDLDPATADPQWLLVLAHLQQRTWLPGALSTATGMPLDTVRRVMSVLRFSGLSVDEVGAARARSRVQAPSPAQARSFLRVAKRFGMKLLGMQHG